MKFGLNVKKMTNFLKINLDHIRTPYLAHKMETTKWGPMTSAHAQKIFEEDESSPDLFRHVQ